jgi:hypothetical protein
MRTLVALLPYLLLAVNTILLLALFFGINQRVRKLRTSAKASEAARETEAARISNTIKELASRIAILEREDRQLGAPEPVASGLNSTLRGKVLKMHRLGQPSDRIADVLRVPRGEVDLLVKVHAIVMRTYQDGTVTEPDGEPVKKG